MFLRVVLGCAAVFVLPVIAPASQRPSTGGLALELARAIQAHPQIGIFDDVAVEVDVDEGRAVLTGRVTSQEKKAGLGARAAQVRGVRSVRNDIGVLPSSAEDDDLRYRIARALYGHPAFWNHAAMPNPPVHIIVEHGHVTLTGMVNTPAERALARSLARGFGERSLSSQLRVRGQCGTPRC